MAYIHLPIDEALASKWERGAERYGTEFVGHPLEELDEELLDAINYVREAERQGWYMGGMDGSLRRLRDLVRGVYHQTPSAPGREGACPAT